MDAKSKIEELKRRVERGEDVRKDFWKLVGLVKRSENVESEIIEELTEIRNKIFDKRIVLSWKVGRILFPSVFVLLNLAFFAAAVSRADELTKAITLFFTEISIVYVAFLTGRILGSKITSIGVEGFYKYNPLEFGMKLDFESYLKVSQTRRVIFFLTPIVFEHAILLFHAVSLFFMRVSLYWIPAALLVVNLPFSYAVHRVKKTGELHRLLRELKILFEKFPSKENQQHGQKS